MAKKIEELLREVLIKNLKRANAIECGPETTVEQAVKIMQEHKSGYVVITDKNKVIGIFTEKDLSLYCYFKEPDWSKVLATKFVKFPLRSLSLNDSVGAAIDLMHTYEYRHVALIDDKGGLQGIISARAIIRFLAENFPAEVLNLPPRADQISHTREGG
ncbi:MAG: CBS domain-containing protein [Candidatus Omnitrophica bacterium]|nr:CBS domain-containing protein [Candidatus Omnitrophota bacterium]